MSTMGQKRTSPALGAFQRYCNIPSRGIGHCMSENHRHQSHPEIVKRLSRAEGHLRSIVEMIQRGRSCLDIAQQLHAVEKAIAQAKKTLIQDHLDNCLEEAVGT